MRACLVTMTLMLLSFFSVSQRAEEKILYKETGFELIEYTLQEATMNTTLYAVVIEPSSMRVEVEGITKTNSNGWTAFDLAKRNKARIVLGSGFVSSFYPLIPKGFLKIDKKIVSPFQANGYNGIVGIKKGKLTLQSPKSIAVLDEGFQTGPYLVRDGKTVYNRESKAALAHYNRAFIGINTSGKIVVAVTRGPVSLLHLSEFLASTDIMNIKCTNVINLAGGGSETLIVSGRGVEFFSYGNAKNNQSALIAFY